MEYLREGMVPPRFLDGLFCHAAGYGRPAGQTRLVKLRAEPERSATKPSRAPYSSFDQYTPGRRPSAVRPQRCDPGSSATALWAPQFGTVVHAGWRPHCGLWNGLWSSIKRQRPPACGTLKSALHLRHPFTSFPTH